MSRQSFQSLQRNLNILLHLLDKSSKQSIKIFDYANEEELIGGQKMLLKFGDKILMYVNEGE